MIVYVNIQRDCYNGFILTIKYFCYQLLNFAYMKCSLIFKRMLRKNALNIMRLQFTTSTFL